MTHKVASRISGVNKSSKKSKSKRWTSNIKVSNSSRKRSSNVEKTEKSKSKGYKYRNLSFYNNQYNEKKRMIKGRIWLSSLGSEDNIKCVLSKKSIQKPRIIKNESLLKSRTRNNKGTIFHTNQTVPYQINNDSYARTKSTERSRLKRVKNSGSNSQSKTKYSKAIPDHASKSKEKGSSRTHSKHSKGTLYQKFYQNTRVGVFKNILGFSQGDWPDWVPSRDYRHLEVQEEDHQSSHKRRSE